MHILHEHYEEMCDKSDTFFLDVLIKNEAKHEDMIHIMQQEQKYIGKGYRGKVLSRNYASIYLFCHKINCYLFCRHNAYCQQVPIMPVIMPAD